MLIVPYTYMTKAIEGGGPTVHRVHVLCQGGRTVWEEDDQDVRNVLETNGIYLTDVKTDRGTNTHYVKIDTARTDMSSMYTWQELPYNDEQSLCWRTFTLVRAPNGSAWLPTVNEGPFATIVERVIANL